MGQKINFSKPSEAYQYIKNFWKRRSLRMKVFISVTGLVAIFTGGSGAGIAALGTAVGLPLAIVLGSASSVAVMFYEEIMGEVPNLQTSYREIEAKKDKHRPRVQNLIAKLKR